MDPATAAGIMQSDYLQGGGGQDAVNLAALRNARLAELRRNIGLGAGSTTGAMGGTSVDAEQLQNDINTDPDTGLAAQAAVQKVTDTNAQQAAYNQPAAAQQRADTQKAAVQLAQAPGVQAGANEQALQTLKNASAEKVAAGHDVARNYGADQLLRGVQAKNEAAANKAGQPTGMVLQMQQKADRLLPTVDKINSEIDRLSPYISAAGGRWNEFMAGTARSADFAADPQDAHDLSQLRTALMGLSAGVAMVHGRGGANMGLVNEYNKQLNIGSDPAILHGAVDGFKGILQQYSTPVGAPAAAAPAKPGIGATPPPSGAAAPAGVTVTRID